MNDKLYGSRTSPFVRRIQVELKDRKYDFQRVNVFEESDRKTLLKLSPHLRVPIWVEQDKAYWDSLIIAEHLQQKPIPIEEKLLLNLVNEMTDSGIQLFQMKKFEVDNHETSMFSKLQKQRMSKILLWFDENLEELTPRAKQWLWISLDWFDYREVYEWRKSRPALVNFYIDYPRCSWINSTNPRRS